MEIGLASNEFGVIITLLIGCSIMLVLLFWKEILMLSKVAKFDRSEWLSRKVKQPLDQRGVVVLELRKGGATQQDIMKFLGKGYACKNQDGTLTIAKTK